MNAFKDILKTWDNFFRRTHEEIHRLNLGAPSHIWSIIFVHADESNPLAYYKLLQFNIVIRQWFYSPTSYKSGFGASIIC